MKKGLVLSLCCICALALFGNLAFAEGFKTTQKAAEAYLKALLNNDMSTAYEMLSNEEKQLISLDKFKLRLELTEPDERVIAAQTTIKVKSVEETDNTAKANVEAKQPNKDEVRQKVMGVMMNPSMQGLSKQEGYDKIVNDLKKAKFTMETNSLVALLIKDAEGWHPYLNLAMGAKVEELKNKSYFAYKYTPEELEAYRDELAEVMAVMPEDQKLQKIFVDTDKQVKDNEAQANYGANIEVFDVQTVITTNNRSLQAPHYTFKVRNNGDRAVEKIMFKVIFLDENGQEIGSKEKQVFYFPGIAANGGVWEPPAGDLNEARDIPDTWKENALKFEVLDVKFKQ